MKQTRNVFFVIFLLTLLALLLSSCASEAATPKTAPDTKTKTTASTTEQPISVVNATLQAQITASVPQTSASITTTEAPKASVLDIPGATVFENDGRFQTTKITTAHRRRLSQEEQLLWAQHIKENNSLVVGYVKSSSSVLVPSGDAYYRVSTMEIEVLKDICHIGKETVTAVYACRYENDSSQYKPVTAYCGTENISITNDMFEEALSANEVYKNQSGDFFGVFLLKDASAETLTIEQDTYRLSDYADYLLDAAGMMDRLGIIGFRGLWGWYGTLNRYIIEDVFGKESFLPEVSTPDQDPPANEKYDHIDIINDEGYEGILDMGGSYFTFENAYAAFDNRPALVLSMTNSNNIFDYLFATSLNPTTGKITREAVPDYPWFVTIEGKQYEIKTILAEVETKSKLVYLDLGPDFSWELFDYDENGKYTFKEVRLDIYRPISRFESTLLYFANLTDDALYGGYTHTKPN